MAAAVVPVLAREVVQQAVRCEPREEAEDTGERHLLAGRLRQLAQAVGVEVVVAGVAERVDRRCRHRPRRGQLRRQLQDRDRARQGALVHLADGGVDEVAIAPRRLRRVLRERDQPAHGLRGPAVVGGRAGAVAGSASRASRREGWRRAPGRSGRCARDRRAPADGRGAGRARGRWRRSRVAVVSTCETSSVSSEGPGPAGVAATCCVASRSSSSVRRRRLCATSAEMMGSAATTGAAAGAGPGAAPGLATATGTPAATGADAAVAATAYAGAASGADAARRGGARLAVQDVDRRRRTGDGGAEARQVAREQIAVLDRADREHRLLDLLQVRVEHARRAAA